MSTKPEKLQPLPPHRFALLFPAMTDEEFRNLVGHRGNWQRVPITTYEENGTIFVLEGLHRHRTEAHAVPRRRSVRVRAFGKPASPKHEPQPTFSTRGGPC